MVGEWQSATVGEVTDRVTKGTTPTSIGGGFVEHGISFVKVESLAEDGRILPDKLAYIDDATDALLQRSRLEADDILFTIAGTIGRTALVPNWLLPANTNQAVAIVRPKREVVDPRFLFYTLRDERRVKHAQTRVVQSVQANFSLGELSSLEIPLPPLAEQKAIAAVLGALDDKIELNRRMNATLEAMARALFQSWFVDFDPVRAKLDGRKPVGMDAATAALFPAAFQESSLGPIPKGWTAGKLGDIASNPRRGVQPDEIKSNTPYIALEHMPRRCIALGEWADSADVASGKSAFKKGEVLFGKLRPYFHKVGVAPIDGVCSTDILVLAPKSPEWFGFLLGHASSDELIQFTDLASTGTKMPRTNWGDISSFKVAIPPSAIAAEFTRVVEPMIERIHANLHQSRTLATLRDTLLPKLLSGELSVAGLDSAADAGNSPESPDSSNQGKLNP